MRILLVDMSNIIRKNAFAAIKDDPYDNGVWIKTLSRTIGDIFRFNTTYKADRCILAMDDAKYWRTGIYQDYKANRRKFKEDSVLDFDSLDARYFYFMERVKSILKNICILKIDECEGDDIIACITKQYALSENEITIISADKDFNQLIQYQNVKHINPVTRKEVTLINPKVALAMKVILGDINDYIPSIKRGVGKKTAEKFINDNVDLMNSSDTLLSENYKRNRRLIDFDFIPSYINDRILAEYAKFIPSSINAREVFSLLMEFGAADAIDAWQQNKERIMALK